MTDPPVDVGLLACRRGEPLPGPNDPRPSLPGLVDERDIEIAGSGVGVILDQPVLGDQLGPGDECVLVESSGLHTNGASLARLVASRDPEGYAPSCPAARRWRRRCSPRLTSTWVSCARSSRRPCP